jgi:5-methyltetrahydrofolate--homocysteine methyltransferase
MANIPEYDFSKGFARMAQVMGGTGSALPFTAQMHEFAMKQTGSSGHRFYTEPEALVRGILDTCRDFRFDTPFLLWDVYNVEAEALGANLALFDDMAPAIDNVAPIIETEKDLARLQPPDPARAGRMPMVADALGLFRDLTGVTPPPCYCAPFTLAAQCMTFEKLVLAINDDPAFVHRVLTFLVDEVIAPYMNAMTRLYPDATVVDGSDAIASLPFITQSMLEEFSLHYIERLGELCDRPVICDNWWGDSYADDLEGFWALKLRATPPYLKVQDPDLFKVGVERAKDYAVRRGVPLVLGVDNNVLQQGPAEAIEKRIHEYMEVGEPHGGCVLYLCSLSAQTPAEHVRIAIDAIERFRAGDRPYAGLRESGTEAARGDGARPAEPKRVARVQTASSEDDEALLDDIFDAVLDHEDGKTPDLVRQALDRGMNVHAILEDALIAAMDDVGRMFGEGAIFVPEMLMAARAMKAGLEVVRPVLTETGAPPRGKVMLATVQGDVHDIGKNLVGMMLEGAGYEVTDLGVNVSPEDVLARARALAPDVVGPSALLTTSMPSMQKTVDLFKDQGAPFPLLVGGAPVTQEFAGRIGADGYGEDAPLAVEAVNRLVEGMPAAA